jgi:hypothetical protein
MALTQQQLDTLTELQLERAGASRFAVNIERLKEIRAEDRNKTAEEIAAMVAEREAQKAAFQAKAKQAFKVQLPQ